MATVRTPRSQTARNAFRVVGALLMALALFFIISAFVDFFSFDNGLDGSGQGPTKFWMFFVGIPLFAVGGWCLQAGFVGVAARYGANQTVAAVREFGSAFRGEEEQGPFCSSCGARQASDARFCHACGHALG